MKNLVDMAQNLRFDRPPGQDWAISGPEAAALGAGLNLPVINLPALSPGEEHPPVELDGLVLAGALSAADQPETWLTPLLKALRPGGTLIIIDWQADGPLTSGPELERRVSRGWLRRLLREAGFGTIDTVVDGSFHYVIRAIKEPPVALAHRGEFVALANLAELPKNGMKAVELFGHALIVANTGKEIVAFARACPHAGHPLDRGRLRGRNLVCALHFYIWNVATGEPVAPPYEDILPRYPVKVDAASGQIWVALSD